MPQIITCSHCHRSLRVPDNLMGKKVRCPSCRVQFVAGGDEDDDDIVEDFTEEPPAKAPARRPIKERTERISDAPRPRRRHDEEDDSDEDDDYEDDSSRGPSPREEKEAWKKVHLGLHLEMLGIWIWLGSLGVGLLFAVLSFLVSFASMNLMMVMGILMYAAVGLGALAQVVLTLIGYILCAFAPPKPQNGLRPLGIAACGLMAGSIVLEFFTVILAVFTAASISSRGSIGFGIVGILMTLLVVVCVFSALIVHIFFLRSVCRNTRAKHLAGQPISVLIGFIIYGFCSSVIYAILLVSIRVMGQAAIYIIPVVMIVIGVTGLAMMYWYSTVLRDIRDAVDSYRRQRL